MAEQGAPPSSLPLFWCPILSGTVDHITIRRLPDEGANPATDSGHKAIARRFQALRGAAGPMFAGAPLRGQSTRHSFKPARGARPFRTPRSAVGPTLSIGQLITHGRLTIMAGGGCRHPG